MLRQLFYLLNFGTLALFAVAVVKDYDTEWRAYQKEYFRMEVSRLTDAVAAATDEEDKNGLQRQLDFYAAQRPGVSQIISTDLERYDRCTSCHVGFDEFRNPSQVNTFTEHPYAAPEVAAHKAHNLSKIGCTVCHGGQGLATKTANAHGEVHHWEEPLLRGQFVQASCVKCHGDFHTLKGAEHAASGYKLFRDHGCLGCHAYKGWGGNVSVELGEIASKPLSRVHFEHDLGIHGHGMEGESIKKWIELHLKEDTWKVVPGDPAGVLGGGNVPPSGMPPFHTVLSAQEADDITTFLLGGSEEKIPASLYKGEYGKLPEMVTAKTAKERGRQVFHKYGCSGCHGVDAKQPWRNFNARALEEGQTEMGQGSIPYLPKLMGTYTRPELKKKIHEGVPSSVVAKFDPNGPTPPLYMPAWEGRVEGQELEDLITWLLSIAEKDDTDWD